MNEWKTKDKITAYLIVFAPSFIIGGIFLVLYLISSEISLIGVMFGICGAVIFTLTNYDKLQKMKRECGIK